MAGEAIQGLNGGSSALSEEQVKDALGLPAASGQDAPSGRTREVADSGRSQDAFWRTVIFALSGMLVGWIIGYAAFGKPLAAAVLCFALGVLASQVLRRRKR